MRILIVHNYTEGFATGGEAHVFEDEARLLESHGHEVRKLLCSNSEATDAPLFGKVLAFVNAPWSLEGCHRMSNAIREFAPDVIHVHNFFLILSPSIFKAAHDHNVPVVLTLHNYRLVSPCSQLLRKNKICERCVGRNPWRLLMYRCYKNSFSASLLRYRIYYSSRKKYKWGDYIGAYIALTDFGKAKLVQGGVPGGRLRVVPNCVPDPLRGQTPTPPGHGALYVGTVTRDKGVRELVEAWSTIDYPLTIVGEGDLRQELIASAPSNVKIVGLLPREKVMECYNLCSFVVMPSLCYEGMPLVGIESMAMGRAIVGSGHGAVGAIIKNGETGLHFLPGNVDDMRDKIAKMINDGGMPYRFGLAAREAYLVNYTPERHYERLIKVYEELLSKGEGH